MDILIAVVYTAGDDAGTLSSALGLVLDAQAVLGGPRLKRGVMIIEDGKVLYVAVEPTTGQGDSFRLRAFNHILNYPCFTSYRLSRRRSTQATIIGKIFVGER